MATTVLATKHAQAPAPLDNSFWYRNEDIQVIITIEEMGQSLIQDIANGKLSFVVKEKTTPASVPLKTYTSEAAGGITISYKSADKIIANLEVESEHLASLSASTDVVMEGQTWLEVGTIKQVLHRATFTSKMAI